MIEEILDLASKQLLNLGAESESYLEFAGTAVRSALENQMQNIHCPQFIQEKIGDILESFPDRKNWTRE